MSGDSYEIELAEENAVVHIQAMVLRLLDAKQITRVKLAETMGVSQAHISQLLGDNPKNLSVRKAARVFHALGEELIITCAGIEDLDKEAEVRNAHIASLLREPAAFDWADVANSNHEPCDDELIAA